MRRLAWLLVVLPLLLTCRPASARHDGASTGPAADQSRRPASAGDAASAGRDVASRDLSRDEALGGHTLARHVGRTDDQLRERLQREPGISAASSYTDRETAERTVAAALEQATPRLRGWLDRRGSRPNLALHYRSADGRAVGSSLERGASRPRPSTGAVVVLRWDDRRGEYFVLTSYPETPR
jgi:hypothetical protein